MADISLSLNHSNVGKLARGILYQPQLSLAITQQSIMLCNLFANHFISFFPLFQFSMDIHRSQLHSVAIWTFVSTQP